MSFKKSMRAEVIQLINSNNYWQRDKNLNRQYTEKLTITKMGLKARKKFISTLYLFLLDD